MQVAQIDDLSIDGIQHLFREARDPDYTALLSELAKLKRSQPDFDAQLNRMRERFKEIVAIDFFESSSRKKVEDAMLKLTPQVGKQGRAHTLSISAYKGRAWVTRPRPGIDRVSSAWLIRRFIDADAKFSFATSAPGGAPDVVPFDMYESGGFGHEGDACTFETICKSFNLSEQKVGVIAEMIHDADLEDARFGRSEGFAINSVLKGWAVQNLADDEILRRGIDLIEGLYLSMAGEAQ